jgi:ABC-2 type transport system permease protein
MRYIRLLGIFYRNCLLQELEYRVNFVANILMSGFWLAWAVLGISVFFLHRDRVGGWSFPQVLMVAALYTLFNGLMDALWRPNVAAVIGQIRDGSFDFVLAKPINAQFVSSLRRVVVWRFADVLIGLGLIVYALRLMQVMPTVAQIGGFAMVLALGTIIMYSLWLTMVSLAFWFVKIDNITEVFSAFYEAGRYPISIYPGLIRALLTFLVPVAFVTTFPIQALMGELEMATILMGAVLAVFFFFGSNRFWNHAVRHYASASS